MIFILRASKKGSLVQTFPFHQLLPTTKHQREMIMLDSTFLLVMLPL